MWQVLHWRQVQMIEYWTLYVRPNSESILLSQKSIYGFILMQKQSQNTNYENYWSEIHNT